MKNPWTKKNPFMSIWLSSANSVAGAARGRVAAEGRRQSTAVRKEATKQVYGFWSDLLSGPKRRPVRGAKKRR